MVICFAKCFDGPHWEDSFRDNIFWWILEISSGKFVSFMMTSNTNDHRFSNKPYAEVLFIGSITGYKGN
jgi:hypothetical protein